jgi:hypothetical protein
VIDLSFQPKQALVLDLVQESVARVIGVGGGRGAAKSGGADRIAIDLLMEWPGVLGCIAMRNYDQVRKYHIEPMMRDFPSLDDYYSRSDANIQLPVGSDGNGQLITSQLDFSYAESLPDVERRFRSANYGFIIVDQAEQFTEQELREMRKACRRRGGGRAIFLLLFNMGGVGIQALRKWFHTLEYNDGEDPKDYVFVHVFPWDNVEWVRAALAEDNLTPKDYYSWTDAERKEYAATRGEYTRQLATDDPAIRARDWEGSWDSLEGAYFGRVYDRQSTLITREQVAAIIKPWDKRWLSQDWGKAHFCCTQWHAKSVLTPSEAKGILGWDVDKPLNVITTYRRLIVNELTSTEVGKKIADATPQDERAQIKQFFLSPDAFGERDSANTIADNQGDQLKRANLPRPTPADTDRPGGWTMMHSLLWNTKTHGKSGDTVWLIGAECPEIHDALPILMRDPKDLDVVLKTDKGQARLEQDVSECSRYGLKSMLGNVSKPFSVLLEEKVSQAFIEGGGTRAHMVHLQELDKHKPKKKFTGRQYQ